MECVFGQHYLYGQTNVSLSETYLKTVIMLESWLKLENYK